MSDLNLALRLTAEATQALAGLKAVQGAVKATGAEARGAVVPTRELDAALVEAGTKGKAAIVAATVSVGQLTRSLTEVAKVDPGEAIRASFDALRASVDPAFAAAQRYRDIQISLAEMVASGAVRQSSANIVLEQAQSRYLGVATAAERLAAAEAEQTAATAASAAGLQDLIAQFDPLYANSVRYEQAIARITAALEAEAISEAQANRLRTNAGQQLLGFSGAAGKVAGEVEKMGFAANLAAGGGLRGIGLQLSQVAQQGAVTGNYFTALTTQLPDIGLAFGGVGIAVGALAAVLGPVLLAALGTAQSAEERLATASDTLANSLSGLKAITAEFASGDLTTLKQKYGEVDAQLLTLIGHQREEQVIGAQNAAKDAVAALADEYGVASGELNLFRITGQGAAADVARALGMTKDQFIGFQQAIKAAQNAKTFQEQADALALVDGYLKRSAVNGSDLANHVTSTALTLREVAVQAKASETALEAATHQTRTFWGEIGKAFAGVTALTNAQPGAGWLATAISQAEKLSGRLWDAVTAARLAAMQTPYTQPDANGRVVDRGALMGNMTGRGHASSVNDNFLPVVAKGASTSSSGSGRAPVDSLGALQAQAQSAMTALDAAIASINEKVKVGLLSTKGAADAVASAKETAAGAIADLLPKIDQMGPKGAAAADTWRGALKSLADQLKGVGAQADSMGKTMADNFTQPFADFLAGTKSAGDAWDSFLSGINQAIASKLSSSFTNNILGPLLDGLFSSMGGVKLFADGGVPGLPALSGTVLSQATAFAMPGGGLGVAGEAGTEAIMPVKRAGGGFGVTGLMGGHEVLLGLGRGHDGKLGVTLPAPRAFAAGGVPGAAIGTASAGFGPMRAGNTQIIVNNNAPQSAARVEERMQGNDHIISIMIDAVSDAIAENITAGRGAMPGAMQSVYGLARQGR
jgi:hypothetical protein